MVVFAEGTSTFIPERGELGLRLPVLRLFCYYATNSFENLNPNPNRYFRDLEENWYRILYKFLVFGRMSPVVMNWGTAK